MQTGTYKRAVLALSRSFSVFSPAVALSTSGYVGNWTDNLLPGTDPKWFEEELSEGDGRELENKFKAAHSSSALVVNSFARFKTSPNSLSIAGYGGFSDFRFEAKCSAGIRGGRAPNLDLLALGLTNLAIESKCTEHLRRHIPTFSLAYDLQIRDKPRRDSAWFRLMKELTKAPSTYCYFDAAQMIKHAFGLARCFPKGDVDLLYIFWEPKNAGAFLEFKAHREEVARFANEVRGALPHFVPMSYRELWDEWSRMRSPPWLAEHVAALRARYDVEI